MSKEDVIRQLIQEVNYMPPDTHRWLRDLWRARYGYSDALPSIEEMAVELGRERKLL